jgi:hypothetical protein
MKKLNALNLGKGLNRNEMKNVNGGGAPGQCSFYIGSQYYSGVNSSTYNYVCGSYSCTGVSCS